MQISACASRCGRSRRSIARSVAALAFAAVFLAGAVGNATAASDDIVLYASDAATVAGDWSSTSDSTAAGGKKLASPADGWSHTTSPLASPNNYVDFTFSAPANVPYTFWIRLQAQNNSKYSDSVWVQFSDAEANGTPAYAIASTNGLLVNLATDTTASSDQAWGWVDGAYWLTQPATVTFANSGTHTVRVQVREDGVQFDQIVLSPTTYFNATASCPTNCTGAPGPFSNDSTIVPKPGTAGTASPSTGSAPTAGGAPAAGSSPAAGAAPAGGTAPAPSTSTATSSNGSGATLNVITWNIEVDDSSEAHARQAMDLLVATSPQPQVIVIEEAYSNWFATYIDELQKRTGVTWHGAFATHCASGNWNGTTCTQAWNQGVGIFSTYPIADSSSTYFPYPDCWTSARVSLRAAIDVNGTTVQVFANHLQTGGCYDDAQSRYSSMSDFKKWANGYSKPQLVAGDFNADPDQIDTTSGMLPNFTDSWSIVGSGSGYTAFTPNPSMKLDYWLMDSNGQAQPQSSSPVSSTGTTSDHMPLQATFRIP